MYQVKVNFWPTARHHLSKDVTGIGIYP